jgi:hypothetical protein
LSDGDFGSSRNKGGSITPRVRAVFDVMRGCGA